MGEETDCSDSDDTRPLITQDNKRQQNLHTEIDEEEDEEEPPPPPPPDEPSVWHGVDPGVGRNHWAPPAPHRLPPPMGLGGHSAFHSLAPPMHVASVQGYGSHHYMPMIPQQ